MSRNRSCILVFLMTLLGMSSFAQEWEGQGEIEDAQIVVEKDKKIELPQANRKFEKISKEEVKREPEPQQYNSLTPSLIQLNTVSPRLRVLKVAGEKPEVQIGNYIKAGFGNYVTPYLDAYVASTNENDNNYAVNVYHLSSANGPVKFSGMSDSRIALKGEYFANKNMSVYGGLDYNREGFRYYGLSEDSSIENEDDIRQVYNYVSPKIGIEGNANKLGYKVDGRFDYLTGMLNDVSDINYGYTFDGDYELADKSSILLDHRLLVENFNSSVNRTYMKIKPMYKFLHNGIYITLGLNTVYQNEALNKDKEFHVYPEVFMNYPLIVNEVNVFGGITGDLERNTFRSWQQEAQFVMPDSLFQMFNTNKLISFYGGIKGNIAQKLGYKGQISYSNYRNLYLFINNPVNQNFLTATTEIGVTNLLSLKLEGMYNVSKRLVSGINIEYNRYGLSDLDAAYSRPGLILGIHAQYNVKNKVTFTGQLNYIQGLTAIDFTEQKMVSLNDIVDLNFEIDYKLSDKFSTFVMLNNIVGTKYQYFLNYPTKSLNAIVGVTYSF